MRVSTKGRYALRFMVALAANYNSGYITTKNIAAQQQISEKYLEQIINVLNKSGFVTGVRGPLGGYALAMPPEEITVGMVLRAVEGSFSPVFCVDDSDNECSRKEKCVTIEVWKKMKEAVDGVVDAITLDYLAKKSKSIDEGIAGKCEKGTVKE